MPTALENLFSNIPQLPSLPRVVTDLIQTMGNNDASIDDIVEKLRHDPNLSGRVLRLANSSHYGASRKIGAIDDAVALIGLDALRTLVIASGVSSAFKAVPNLDLKAFWHEALVVAGLSRALAKQGGKVNPEFAYSAGLMHRLGVLVLHMGFPDAAAQIARDCKDLTVGERPALERMLAHVTHTEAGERLAKNWHFPDEICTALRHYADANHPDANDLARILMVATEIALEHAHGDADAEIASHLPAPMLAQIDISESQLTETFGRIPALEADAAAFL